MSISCLSYITFLFNDIFLQRSKDNSKLNNLYFLLCIPANTLDE